MKSNIKWTIGEPLIQWLLEGDIAIQYQRWRDLIGEVRPDLQARILEEGWGARFLAARHAEGYWGRGYYQPKWTNSHYTLLDIRNLCPPADHPQVRESIQIILDGRKSSDGGINPAKTTEDSDVCINGMMLHIACYFHMDAGDLTSIVDFLLHEHMADGGFNCRSTRSGARHSSLHTTLSVMEGIHEYQRQGYTYRLAELMTAYYASLEFILIHQLYISDRTGEIIHPAFLRIPYPSRWKYDILRALDHFQDARIPWDDRMGPAMAVLLKKRRPDGTWPVQAKYPGQVHFDMEKAGGPSRWNTLRMLRVMKRYDSNYQVLVDRSPA